jgi:hypothetical protein
MNIFALRGPSEAEPRSGHFRLEFSAALRTSASLLTATDRAFGEVTGSRNLVGVGFANLVRGQGSAS